MDNSDHTVDFAKPFILSSADDSKLLLILITFYSKNMSHCLALTLNPLPFIYLIANSTLLVLLLAFSLRRRPNTCTTYCDLLPGLCYSLIRE